MIWEGSGFDHHSLVYLDLTIKVVVLKSLAHFVKNLAVVPSHI